jgi:hypothetical protein
MSITRTTWTDGSTVINNARLQAIYDALDGRWSEATTTSTGSQNNFSISEADVLRCNNASLLTLTGIVAPASPAKPGKRLVILSVGAGQVDIANQNASSTAANRIINGVTGTISLAAGYGCAILVYDDTTDRWRVVSHDQGAWITPTFAAGSYTASGGTTPTWTVASGDVTTRAYWLRSRQMTEAFSINTSTVGNAGAGTTGLAITIANSLTATKTIITTGVLSNAGGGNEACNVYVSAAGTTINIQRIPTAVFTNGTDNHAVHGIITFEVN